MQINQAATGFSCVKMTSEISSAMHVSTLRFSTDSESMLPWQWLLACNDIYHLTQDPPVVSTRVLSEFLSLPCLFLGIYSSLSGLSYYYIVPQDSAKTGAA